MVLQLVLYRFSYLELFADLICINYLFHSTKIKLHLTRFHGFLNFGKELKKYQKYEGESIRSSESEKEDQGRVSDYSKGSKESPVIEMINGKVDGKVEEVENRDGGHWDIWVWMSG